MNELLLLFFFSVIANVFSAFAGGGAGLIQLPLLLFLGLPFSLALSTHKVASVALGLGATLRHLRSNSLEWKFSFFILLSGVPGVVLGGFIIVNIANPVAELSLGILMISLGIYSLNKPQLGQVTAFKHRQLRGFFIGGLVLCLIGVLNGSLTSGTGLFVTMWLIYWFGLDYKQAVAYTLVLVGVFWNGSGAITLGLLSDIKWEWLPVLISGSLLGGYIGAHLSIVSGNKWIKKLFEIITILIGLLLIEKSHFVEKLLFF